MSKHCPENGCHRPHQKKEDGSEADRRCQHRDPDQQTIGSLMPRPIGEILLQLAARRRAARPLTDGGISGQEHAATSACSGLCHMCGVRVCSLSCTPCTAAHPTHTPLTTSHRRLWPHRRPDFECAWTVSTARRCRIALRPRWQEDRGLRCKERRRPPPLQSHSTWCLRDERTSLRVDSGHDEASDESDERRPDTLAIVSRCAVVSSHAARAYSLKRDKRMHVRMRALHM